MSIIFSSLLPEIYGHTALISEILPNNHLSIKYKSMGEKLENKIAISHAVLSNYLKYGGTGRFSYFYLFPYYLTCSQSEFSVMNKCGTFIVNMMPCEVRFYSRRYFKFGKLILRTLIGRPSFSSSRIYWSTSLMTFRTLVRQMKTSLPNYKKPANERVRGGQFSNVYDGVQISLMDSWQ